MLCPAVKGDPTFSIEGSRFDRISEFSELPRKDISPYSGSVKEMGSEMWISGRLPWLNSEKFCQNQSRLPACVPILEDSLPCSIAVVSRQCYQLKETGSGIGIGKARSLKRRWRNDGFTDGSSYGVAALSHPDRKCPCFFAFRSDPSHLFICKIRKIRRKKRLDSSPQQLRWKKKHMGCSDDFCRLAQIRAANRGKKRSVASRVWAASSSKCSPRVAAMCSAV